MALARVNKIPQQELIQFLGTVIEVKLDKYIVECDNRFNWTCNLAASCLLQPSVQDKVLISRSNIDNTYITAVLQQHDPSTAKINLAGSLEISTGNLDLNSLENLTIQSNNELNLSSQHLNFGAEKSLCNISEMQYFGKKLTSTVTIVKYFSKVYEAIIDRISQISNYSLRKVNKVDKLIAENINYKAEQTTKILSTNTTIKSKELTKVDGKQIHMG